MNEEAQKVAPKIDPSAIEAVASKGEDPRITKSNETALSMIDAGDFIGAIMNFTRSHQLAEETDNKQAQAVALNNIGHVYVCIDKEAKALEKYTLALELSLDCADIIETARSYHNLGTYYERQKDYKASLQNLFQSVATIKKASEEQPETTLEALRALKQNLKYSIFKELALEVYGDLGEEFKEHVDIEELTKNETVRNEGPQTGRNDPCPCGSGKKYKKCCG